MEPGTYQGGCHCGKVRYEVTTDLDKVMSCNCSICSKLGVILSFVPENQFKLLSGESDLTDYQFNTMNVHHLFCRVCGIESFMRGAMPDGTKVVGLNVRCLDGVDLAALQPIPFDGRSL